MTCAIVLAAGRSQRMGARKLLLPFAGSTLVARVVDACLQASVDQVLVVVRPNDPEVRAALGDRMVEFTENPDVDGDMLSSLRCGLRAMPPAASTVLVSPADQPSLEPQIVRGLLAAFRTCNRGILVPTCQGRRGHPPVFSARYRDELLTGYDGTGLRGLLRAHAGEVVEWPTDAPAVLEDIDTPTDYERSLRAHPDSHAGGSVPPGVGSGGGNL